MPSYAVALSTLIEAKDGDEAADLAWEACMRAFPHREGQVEIRVRERGAYMDEPVRTQDWASHATEFLGKALEAPVKEDTSKPEFQVTVISREQRVMWEGLVRADDIPAAIQAARSKMERKGLDMTMVAGFSCKGIK